MELVYTPGLSHAPAPAEAAPAAPPASHATHCLNCEVALAGPYCAQCGQAGATHRITVGHLLHEIPHTIWHLDKGLFFTMRELLLRPGAVILGYLRGQRVRYFAPLSLLLLVMGLSSLLATKLHLSELTRTLTPQRTTELQQAQTTTTETMFSYVKWFYVGLAPLAGWVVRRTLRRAHLNLAEAIVALFYVTAGATLLSLLPMVPFFWFRSAEAYGRMMLLLMLVQFGYEGWAYGQLLRGSTLGSFGRWWRGVFTSIMTYLLIITCSTVLMFALNWSTWTTAFRHDFERRQAERQQALPARPAQPAPAHP